MMLPEEEYDLSSECSSGCQSGWTDYLYHSSSLESPCPFVDNKAGSFRHGEEGEEQEEEEDLSMVSDASSGPPHFHEDDEHSSCFRGCGGCLCSALWTSAAESRKKRRVEPQQQGWQQHSSLLDDTASSPLFSCPKISFDGGSDTPSSCIKAPLDGVLEFSCGSSATHFTKKYALEKRMGFLQSSAASAKQTPARPVSSRKEGRR